MDRGQVGVANLDDLGTGFRITLDGGVDLNIPGINADLEPVTLTTLTLEGKTILDFTILGAGVPEDVKIDLQFEASLSETNFGTIGFANGAFHTTIDFDPVFQFPPELPDVEIWGCGRLWKSMPVSWNRPASLSPRKACCESIALDSEKPAELLKDVDENVVLVELPANSFALRLDGGIDFRILGEEFFTISGIFVLEFSTRRFQRRDLRYR